MPIHSGDPRAPETSFLKQVLSAKGSRDGYLEVPAHHPSGILPPGQPKLHARYYSKDRAADLLLGLSLVFALWSCSMKFSDKTNFYQNSWFCCFNLRKCYLDLPWLTTVLPCLLPCPLSPISSRADSCSLSHISLRACCLKLLGSANWDTWKLHGISNRRRRAFRLPEILENPSQTNHPHFISSLCSKAYEQQSFLKKEIPSIFF